MGGTTTNGYPYVTPDDHPLQFPAHSQALANKLQAQHPSYAWATRPSDNSGAAVTDLSVVSVSTGAAVGRVCTVSGMVRWQSSAVSNITITLRAGAVTLHQYILSTQPANLDQALPIAWTGVPAVGDFQIVANGSAGTQLVRGGSYIAVTVV